MARILIVENESNCAELASVICRAAGHHVALASNGIEALVLLDEQAFDLILTDIIMPKMDGIRLTDAVRGSITRNTEIPIVGMTAGGGNEDLAEMRRAGIDQVIIKPFRNKELLDVVERALDRHRVTTA
jgi:CheY-like chemotaxis protein